MKGVVGNNDLFPLLFKCALVVLPTPHSNATIDGVFYLFNKNKSEGSNRNRLDNEGTLLLLLLVKLDRPGSVSSCLDYHSYDKL